MSEEKFYAVCGVVCFCVLIISLTIIDVVKAL